METWSSSYPCLEYETFCDKVGGLKKISLFSMCSKQETLRILLHWWKLMNFDILWYFLSEKMFWISEDEILEMRSCEKNRRAWRKIKLMATKFANSLTKRQGYLKFMCLPWARVKLTPTSGSKSHSHYSFCWTPCMFWGWITVSSIWCSFAKKLDFRVRKDTPFHIYQNIDT